MVGFQAHSLEDNTNALAAYLPNDRLFAAKNLDGTNLRKMLVGLGGELTRVDQIFQSIWDGTNILETIDPNYITAWESAVGIPNTYFTQTVSLTIEQRRQQILIQLQSLGVLTEQDFIDLAALLGYTITIQQGINVIYPPYSVPFIPIRNASDARFIMFVNGLGSAENYPAYSVPFLPQNPAAQLQTLFNILKPANTIIIYLF